MASRSGVIRKSESVGGSGPIVAELADLDIEKAKYQVLLGAIRK
jgi:hypothetical protein